MKTHKKSFAGSRPVFTVAPVVEIGGFTIDKTAQNLVVGDVIPEGTLVVHDETTRKVVLVKTGKVKAIDENDAKIVTLESNDFANPNFAPGDKVAKTAGGAYSGAISIVSVVDGDNGYIVTLSGAITGLAVGDVIGEVIKDGSNNQAFRVGTALSLTSLPTLATVPASSVAFSPSTPRSFPATACSSRPTRLFVSPTASKEVRNG